MQKSLTCANAQATLYRSTQTHIIDDQGERANLPEELGSIIESGLRNISEDYRIVFTLRELNGMSVTETSEAANISISNVKVRLNRAKEMLRSEISKMYRPEDIFEFNLVYCDCIVNKVMSHIITNPVPETR